MSLSVGGKIAGLVQNSEKLPYLKGSVDFSKIQNAMPQINGCRLGVERVRVTVEVIEKP